MFLKNRLVKLGLFIFLCLIEFSLSATENENSISTKPKRLSVTRILNSTENSLKHKFLKKCIGVKELPKVSLPVVLSMDLDGQSSEYTLQFNGSNIEPFFIDGNIEIPLEKTTEGLGYVITLTRPSEEKEFSLDFQLKNNQGERIFHKIEIKNDRVYFSQILTDEQKNRVCIRDRFFLGIGSTEYSSSQAIAEMQSSDSWASQNKLGTYAIGGTYHKTSWLEFYGQARSLKIKIDSPELEFVKNSPEIKSIEIGTILRTAWFRPEFSFGLFSPNLILSAEQITLPAVHLSRIADPGVFNFDIQNFVVGLGIDIFLFESIFVSFSYKIKSKSGSGGVVSKQYNQSASEFKLLKSFQERYYFGINFTQGNQKYDFSRIEGEFLNTGTIDSSMRQYSLLLGATF